MKRPSVKLIYILTMPGVGSWNGRWSGEGKLYARIEAYGASKAAHERAEKILAGSPYYYRWNDGWAASVEVREATRQDAARVRRDGQGFCGYDWMIDSIERDQAILPRPAVRS